MTEYPSPLPLWPTPWYLKLLGYPRWRYIDKHDMNWIYLPNSEYERLFIK